MPIQRPDLSSCVSCLRRRWLGGIALATLGVGLAPQAIAQAAWPNKPVTVVVPFPVGGGTDAFGRPLFMQIGRQLGQQVVIDNRGGAAGNLGAAIAAKAAPDGYTWFMGAVHHAIAPAIYPKMEYSLANDFVPVALLSSVSQVVVVNPSKVSARTLGELLAHLRANPGKLSYASAGNGSSHHLAGELFKIQTRTFITHIPYRGAGPALQDLIGGQVELMFDGLGSSSIHIKSGRLRPLAVAGDKRSPGFPDIPTSAEAGLPSYKVATWYGLWAPKGTPKEIVDRMAAELRTAFASKEIRDTWNNLGSEIPTLAGADFGAFVASEMKRWATVVQDAGIKMD